jgi:hypothetical protein
VPKAFNTYFGFFIKKTTAGLASAMGTPSGKPVGSESDPRKTGAAGERTWASEVPPPSKEIRRITGVSILGRSVRVFWSDGMVTTERDPLLQSVERGLVTYGGRSYALAPHLDAGERAERAAVVSAAVSAEKEQAPRPAYDSSVANSDDGLGSWKRGADGVERLRSPQGIGQHGK